MCTLTDYLNKNNVTFKEGYSQQVDDEVHLLKRLVQKENVNRVLEIGFHAGHSSELFLKANPNCTVTSFDIGSYSYVKIGKEFIDSEFPKRHTLILGNSLVTVPEYIKTNNTKFDLIFIDGGHSVDVASGDIENCKYLSNKETIVVMDDIVNQINLQCHWNKGPTEAWNASVNSKTLREKGHEDFEKGRGASWGFYNL